MRNRDSLICRLMIHIKKLKGKIYTLRNSWVEIENICVCDLYIHNYIIYI